MAKTLELKLTDGKTKDGREYIACDLLLDGVQLTRMFLKPTEIAFYQDVEGVYKKAPDAN